MLIVSSILVPIIFAGCANLPEHYDVQYSTIWVKGTPEQAVKASTGTLYSLGCDSVNTSYLKAGSIEVSGRRPFLWGFLCGSGGEEFFVNINTDPDNSRQHMVCFASCKKLPYIVSPCFRNKEFTKNFTVIYRDSKKHDKKNNN